MNNIDKITEKVEKIIEKIKGLNHKFSCPDSESDAEISKEDAINCLETWLETVTVDIETSEEDSDED